MVKRFLLENGRPLGFCRGDSYRRWL
ncbi:hypothetical protein ZOSMA_2583G00010, partial [Zostera marina]